jgi:ribose transport system permease protein
MTSGYDNRQEAAATGASPEAPDRQPNVVNTPPQVLIATDMRDRIAPWTVPFVLVLAFGIFSLISPHLFPNWANVRSILDAQAVVLVLAMGLMLPLRSGDFDLSIGSVMLLAAAVMTVLTSSYHVNTTIAVFAALGSALAAGALNGVIIVYVGVNAFVTTLGTMTAISGVTYAVTSNNVLTQVPSAITTATQHQTLGISGGVILGLILAAVMWYVFRYTLFGRYLLFAGGNREAARLSGVPVDRVRFMAFAGCGLLSGLAGVILAGYLGSVDPTIGGQYLLPPYAAIFLGTTAVQLGRVNVLGTLVGLYLLGVVDQGLSLAGSAPWVSSVFSGGALVAAVIFARQIARHRLE